MPAQSITPPFADERFWAKVDFNGPLPAHQPKLGPCWLWNGARDEFGYGMVFRNRRPQRAHRYAYERTYGLIPDGLVVCHACDRPFCVNPKHFRLGTHKDNSDDKLRKGRGVFVGHSHGDEHWTHRRPGDSPIIGAKGEANPLAKLTEDAVKEIRRRYALGDVSQLALATEYGVSQTVIHHLLARMTWVDVDDADAPPARPRVIVPPRGAARGQAKLTDEAVRDIRARVAAHSASQAAIAREYGVSAASVNMIVKRRTWRHVS